MFLEDAVRKSLTDSALADPFKGLEPALLNFPEEKQEFKDSRSLFIAKMTFAKNKYCDETKTMNNFAVCRG